VSLAELLLQSEETTPKEVARERAQLEQELVEMLYSDGDDESD
jgi:hypothetical protein